MLKDFSQSLAQVFAGHSSWLILLAAVIVGIYLVALLAMTRRQSTDHAQPDRAASSLADLPAWATARGRRAFIASAALLAATVWLLAWTFAPDHRAFWASREWQAQPLYLFAHLVTVRVFASILATNFVAGAAALDMKPQSAVRAVRRLLGWVSFLPTALVAAPFIAIDLRYFLSQRYTKLSGSAEPAAVDWLMLGIWSFEWLLNGLVWSMLVGFLILNIRTLRRFTFTAPIHVVLMQKLYRPFLLMSAQGASVVLVFSIVTAVYIFYASGELTDYIGLIITVALLGGCFLPPWLLLRAKVKKIVQRDIAVLQRAIGGESVDQLVATFATDNAARDRLGAEALLMMRMMHLDRMYDDVGRREATEVTLRLLAPAATIGWQLWQNGATILEKISVWMRGASGL